MGRQTIRLIINADDYAYYPCVSRGILAAASRGAVSATGILANAPGLDEQVDWLREHQKLEPGVHLNLTSRRPLTEAMADALRSTDGHFPGVFAMAGRVLSGRIGLETIREEWRAQIETLLKLGLKLEFLNSHEHIHMLPRLFTLASGLAEEYGIPHLRLTRADWSFSFGGAEGGRNLLIQAMQTANRRWVRAATPVFIGLGRSGKLDLAYLRNLLRKLKPDRVYELMCHPGIYDAHEITDQRLLEYHAWEAELALLTSPGLTEVYEALGVRIMGYRDLP